MADTEAQITEETKLDADDAINASIEAAQVEHGGESDETETETVAADTKIAWGAKHLPLRVILQMHENSGKDVCAG